MTRWLHILFFLCGALLLPGGCITEEGGTPADANGAQVSFVLSLTDAGASTRATWGEGYDSKEGNAYENRIAPDDVQVILFNTSGDRVATVEILSYYPLNDGSDDYRFIGSVTAEDGTLTSGQSYKLMVFANCGTFAADSDLGSLFFTYNEANVKAESQLIPMWGVITPTLTLEKGKQQDLGTIDLLRAMAKIEINLASTISGTHTITGATLSKYNSRGYCLPKDYAAVENTKELEQETGNSKDTFNPCINAPVSSDLAFSYSEDKKTAWLYIPEYDNSPTDAATISITLSDGSNTTTGTLEFKDYANGTATGDAHDIVRNHIYRYTVNVETSKLTVQYKALPWNLVETSIGWKPQPASTEKNPFDDDSYDDFKNGNYYILLPYKKSPSRENLSSLYTNASNGDVEAVYSFVCRPSYQAESKQDILKKGTGGIRYCFLLTGPEGATWEAHLTNTDDFSFSTTADDYFGSEEAEVHMATHGIARDKAYIIQVNAVHNYTGTAEGQKGDEGADTPDYEGTPGEPYFGDEYLTDWGKKKWFGQQVVDTELYITVRLTDGTEYELTINPEYGDVVKNTYFGKRRYAGTDTRIWLRQLRAQYKWGYDDLAKNITPTSTETGIGDFAWWRVNPYWNP
ncbi:hypothetical protein [uncultured Bacteroides sp.]|uniref:hypothetical protein n=1 Tax=uncultured Bacteroides sp. TaxID=162156 RepID=UPI00260F6267|nr:hypothetical protein [uncultured Bacteroides sp.]